MIDPQDVQKKIRERLQALKPEDCDDGRNETDAAYCDGVNYAIREIEAVLRSASSPVPIPEQDAEKEKP